MTGSFNKRCPVRMLLLGMGLLAGVGLTGCQSDFGGQTLPSPYYMNDDVQYFPPGPQFKLRPRGRCAAGLHPGHGATAVTAAGATLVRDQCTPHAPREGNVVTRSVTSTRYAGRGWPKRAMAGWTGTSPPARHTEGRVVGGTAPCVAGVQGVVPPPRHPLDVSSTRIPQWTSLFLPPLSSGSTWCWSGSASAAGRSVGHRALPAPPPRRAVLGRGAGHYRQHRRPAGPQLAPPRPPGEPYQPAGVLGRYGGRAGAAGTPPPRRRTVREAGKRRRQGVIPL